LPELLTKIKFFEYFQVICKTEQFCHQTMYKDVLLVTKLLNLQN